MSSKLADPRKDGLLTGRAGLGKGMFNWASDSAFMRALLIPLSCLVYMSSGSWVILANQSLIKEVGFSFPILLSALGTMASAATAHLSVAAGLAHVRPEAARYTHGRPWLQSVVPVALCQAGTLALGNATYLHLGIGSVQMLKAGTPIFVLLVLVFMRLETPSLPTCISVGLVTVGTLITAATTPEWNVTGLLYSVSAMVTESLRVGLTQFFLKSCNFSVTEGQYVLAPAVSVALLLASLPFELSEALSSHSLRKVTEHPRLFLLAAGLGTLVNYSSYLVIKTSGALSLKVVTMLRNIALVLYGVLVLGESVDPKQCIGYAIALVGFAGYTYFSSKAGSRFVPTPTGTHAKSM